MKRPVRIANTSAFYGDRLSAMRELLDAAEVDVITGDYLAELTMLILWKARQKDPESGYARTFLTQFRQVATECAERGVKVITNAGGLNPAGMAERVRAIIAETGVAVVAARQQPAGQREKGQQADIVALTHRDHVLLNGSLQQVVAVLCGDETPYPGGA